MHLGKYWRGAESHSIYAAKRLLLPPRMQARVRGDDERNGRPETRQAGHGPCPDESDHSARMHSDNVLYSRAHRLPRS